MPTKRTASKTSKGAKKKATKARSSASRTRKKPAAAPSSPLVDVARKIGSTLGDLAVRTGLAGHGDDEPGEPGPTQQS